GEFIYPGEFATFRRYFFEKLKGSLSAAQNDGKKRCNYCGEEAKSFVNFDEIFPFATFDKPNFLPAINRNFSNKVYMICDKCYKVFQNSTTYVQSHFIDKSIIYGIQIWVIPEFFTVDQNTFDRSFKELKDYFLTDKSSKEELLDYITDESTVEEFTSVFHFIFLEQNQAQLIVHKMIEDVPITRIRKLKGIWKYTVNTLGYSFDEKLSTALKTVYRVLNNLVLKEESEAKVMRDLAVNTISQILSAEMVDTSLLKREFVSRISKLMNNDQKKSQFNFILNDFLVLNEFLSKYNSSLEGLI
ncbi:MAG TPA: TM1802 family CRISPR-associated protein, partial [Fervidobacterium sp.]|nr:TM1802 family CRISPR-associated protein [Fervidobacterium sp.]